MEIEDEIKFTHVPKMSIQDLHEVVDNFQGDELVIARIYSDNKIQASVPLVHNLRRKLKLKNESAGSKASS